MGRQIDNLMVQGRESALEAVLGSGGGERAAGRGSGIAEFTSEGEGPG